MGMAMTWDSTATILPALRRWSAKELARWADVSEKTATAWREGRNEPRLSHAMRLAAHNAEIFAAIATAAGHADAAQKAVAAEHLRKALAALGEPT